MLGMFLLAGCAGIELKPSKEFHFDWPDYREPLVQGMQIFQYGKHKIQSITVAVDLPEDFLNQEEIILALLIESKTEGAFEYFSPFIRVNSAFQIASVPVKMKEQRQLVEVTLNPEHLYAGQNILQPSFKWNGNYACVGIGCGYVIYTMAFKDAT
jgi:hypothetical protein